MSGITQTLTYSFLVEMPQALHNFTAGSGNTFKLALFKATASITGTYDANTTNYSQMTADEVVASGYTAGGVTLTSVAPVSSSGVALLSFVNPTFTAALTSRGGLIYNSSSGNRAVAIIDFGADKTSNATFTVQMPAFTSTSALIRLQPQAQ
jgi:hypothetical protein